MDRPNGEVRHGRSNSEESRVRFYRTGVGWIQVWEARRRPTGGGPRLGHRLARLSEEQLRAGFRAGGYTPAEIEVYTQALGKRIADLDAL
jgi:hypothetical protein